MPFALPSTYGWLKHRLLAARRMFYRLKSNYFIEQYKNSQLIPLTDKADSPLLCPICGFSMAELVLNQGWSVRACSATGFQDILANNSIGLWQINLINTCFPTEAGVNNNLSISSK